MTTPARAVLGIDAAWTDGEPSGIALVVERAGRWTCEALAPSYESFLERMGPGTAWGRLKVRGTALNPSDILDVSRSIAPDAKILVAALDLPLATEPITCRRTADDEVSREFGARGCSTHSPSAERPGRISEYVRVGFGQLGLPLATTVLPQPLPALVEVYPHTALLTLLPARRRVPYKVSKSRKYWPASSADCRRSRLLAVWRRILRALRLKAGISIPSDLFELPMKCSTFSEMKRYEDALDALVCAWVGIELLNGRTEPLGDDTAAIWTTRDRHVVRTPSAT